MAMKKWDIAPSHGDIIHTLLKNRGMTKKGDIETFLSPPDPHTLTPRDVGIDAQSFKKAIRRIRKAVEGKEFIVVYADYDADGITSGAIMWETLHRMGAVVMPYIPHRVEEGYGLSVAGIDAVREKYHPTLIITVDHGITAWEKVKYAVQAGIDVIVTDHHVMPPTLPDCTIVHTTQLSGAGVSWFVAKELASTPGVGIGTPASTPGVELAAIGTIADMVPMVGANRAIAKWGLAALNKTTRTGLLAILSDAGLTKGAVGTYEVSHMIAPRLNAAGRIEHALDALRLLCTRQEDKALLLARKLGLTNRQRQQLTMDTTTRALQLLQGVPLQKLLFVVDESYNQGIIGLVAGKLVEEYYRPAIVIAKGEDVSKASARSIAGFNIVEAIRSCSDILVDVGGHPMAAGFTVKTKNLDELKDRLVRLAEKEIDEDMLSRTLRVDAEISLKDANEKLWKELRAFEPHGFGNPQPVFATRGVAVAETRLVGAEGKHLKLRLTSTPGVELEAIAFGMGELYGSLQGGAIADIAYSLDMNEWNGSRRLQLKLKDLQLPAA